MKKIILIGRSCSGKGRLLENLQKLGMGFDVISPGDIFRTEKAKNSEIWKRVKKYIDAGQNAPDDLTNHLVAKRLQHEHPGHLQFLDGFPRTMKQIKVLFKVPANYMVVHVDTPETVCRKRYKERNRHDDHHRAFERKMRTFREETIPVLRFLKGAFGVVEIDGQHTDHEYAKVVNYCGLEDHICHTKADISVIEEFRLWQLHHPGDE